MGQGGLYPITLCSWVNVGFNLCSDSTLCSRVQAGFNLCAAGWLTEARVAYPTTYSNPNCGFGHVGIVDYGTRKNLSETWDTFCYRVKGRGQNQQNQTEDLT